MNAAARLSLYAAGLAVVFAGAFVSAAAVVPDSAVAARQARTGTAGHSTMKPDGVRGLGVAANGLALSPVAAPQTVGAAGTLSFRVVDATGAAVTGFATSHEKQLHLIVVRADGAEFRHVHPAMDASGTWTVPWRWDAAGAYRVFADFVPARQENAGHENAGHENAGHENAGQEDAGHENAGQENAGQENAGNVTLTRTVQVAGAYLPASPQPHATDDVDGFHLSIAGVLAAGTSSELTVTVTRDGEPVTTLEPYLGSFGHLVALREGDLGYLHVHAETAVPTPDATAGPDVRFAAEVPTAGRYLLYLDFKIGEQVRTAEFVLDASAA